MSAMVTSISDKVNPLDKDPFVIVPTPSTAIPYCGVLSLTRPSLSPHRKEGLSLKIASGLVEPQGF